jgi:hypothetical protein
VVLLASARLSRPSSGSFGHYLFALGAHLFPPEISSRNPLNTDIRSSGERSDGFPLGHIRFSHSFAIPPLRFSRRPSPVSESSGVK